MNTITLSEADLSRVIEMTWEDRTPFDAIEQLYGLGEPDVIKLMRSSLKSKAFKNWRTRVTARKTKHLKLRASGVSRSHCPSQYKVRSAKK